MSIPPGQLEELQQRFPGATRSPLPDGSDLVTVPGVQLPAGWTPGVTTLYFIAPIQFPVANPDCFWTDGDLRLSSGGILPQSASVQQPAFSPSPKLWFSWHVSRWDANRDTLGTYVRVIEERLRRTQ